MSLRRRMLQMFLGLTFGTLLTYTTRGEGQELTHWDNVEHLVGLIQVPQQSIGSLTFSDSDLVFTSGEKQARLPLRLVESVQAGSERQETGGNFGKVVRVVIPYGGGAALGLATQKKVGLLVLHYYDTNGGLHEALLRLSDAEASEAQLAIARRIDSKQSAPPSRRDCDSGELPIRLLFEASATVPAEYEALSYENLVNKLQELWPARVVLRGATDGIGCPAEVITVNLTSASKGNAVARTASGPVGLFVDVTRIRADVTVVHDGRAELWKHTFKASRRGDRESLGAPASLASSIARSLKHAV